jgi:hypothetical protein
MILLDEYLGQNYNKLTINQVEMIKKIQYFNERPYFVCVLGQLTRNSFDEARVKAV